MGRSGADRGCWVVQLLVGEEGCCDGRGGGGAKKIVGHQPLLSLSPPSVVCVVVVF